MRSSAVRFFLCGPEAIVRQRLADFIDEMDRRGEAYGTPGDADCSPSVLTRTRGIIDLPDAQAVWLVLSGSARVPSTGKGERLVSAGEAIYWEPGEPLNVVVEDEPLLYLAVDGPALTIGHFAYEQGR